MATVLKHTVAGDGGKAHFFSFFTLFSFFSLFSRFFFFALFSFVARYANCGTVRPTGLHHARSRRKERMHDHKNIYFASGGPRGNTYDRWAEALFIIVPKTSHECEAALKSQESHESHESHE